MVIATSNCPCPGPNVAIAADGRQLEPVKRCLTPWSVGAGIWPWLTKAKRPQFLLGLESFSRNHGCRIPPVSDPYSDFLWSIDLMKHDGIAQGPIVMHFLHYTLPTAILLSTIAATPFGIVIDIPRISPRSSDCQGSWLCPTARNLQADCLAAAQRFRCAHDVAAINDSCANGTAWADGDVFNAYASRTSGSCTAYFYCDSGAPYTVMNASEMYQGSVKCPQASS